MDKEYILGVLREHAIEWNSENQWNVRFECHFLDVSYHNWAVREVLKRIEGSLADPKLVISEFIIDMEQMMRLRADTRTQFEAARDAAKWMLDVVNAMVEPGYHMKGE